MFGEITFVAGLIASGPPPAFAAQVTPEPPSTTAPVPQGGEAPPVILGPDGKPLPKGTRVFTIGPDGKPLPEGARPPAAAPDADKTITVTGRRPRGSVIGNIPPETTLSQTDIRAYGASTVDELLQALAPQTRSGRGRGDQAPVVLLNGRRVSSYAEVAKLPPEAIERMEVLPEEVALKYGYRADQKVVNIVAFERFRSTIGQLSYGVATAGGRDSRGIGANYLRISGNTRFSFDADYRHSDPLFENERNLAQVSAQSGQARYRTLLPATERLSLNGTVSGNVLGDISATLNGRFDANDSRSGLGLGSAGVPLVRDFETRLAHVGTAFGGQIGEWLWSVTGSYDRLSSNTRTGERAGSLSLDEAHSVDSAGGVDVAMNGSAFKLPAGPVSIGLRTGFESRDFRSNSVRVGGGEAADLSRDRGSFQANLDIPLTSRSEDFLPALGSLSINANAEIEDLSDFGTLRTLGYGLSWSPIEAVNFIASVTDEEGAPTMQQLGDPVLVTPNVRTFDFVRQETVDVSRISGGNPNLRSDDRHVMKLGLTVQPIKKTDLTVSGNYIRIRTDNAIAFFPTATPAIEAAFPDRVTRDAGGRLLRIDGRPLNFERWDREELRWGFNFSRPLGNAPPGMQVKVRYGGDMREGELPKNLPPGAKVMRFEAGSPMANRLEGMLSRLNFSIYHSWRLRSEILVRSGGPLLDLLDGSAIGNRGGEARHEIEVQGGAFYRGLGGRFSLNWRSGSTVEGVPGGPVGSTGDLRFSDYASFNLKLFADLGQRYPKNRWLRGTRMSIDINNLFDVRPEVRDAAGATPIGYRPAYLDPLGRSVNLSLRKLFR